MSLCSLIRLIGVCADRDQPEFLCSRSDSRCLGVHVATAGGWLTRYRPREVRNSIYRYRKIHIDYRSKFLYRFILSISIIYGNTTDSFVRPFRLGPFRLGPFRLRPFRSGAVLTRNHGAHHKKPHSPTHPRNKARISCICHEQIDANLTIASRGISNESVGAKFTRNQ